MNELAKDVKSSKEKGWFTLENQEKLFEAGIVVFKLLLTRIKNKIYALAKAREINSAGSAIAVEYSINSLSGAKYLRIAERFVIFS